MTHAHVGAGCASCAGCCGCQVLWVVWAVGYIAAALSSPAFSITRLHAMLEAVPLLLMQWVSMQAVKGLIELALDRHYQRLQPSFARSVLLGWGHAVFTAMHSGPQFSFWSAQISLSLPLLCGVACLSPFSGLASAMRPCILAALLCMASCHERHGILP
jgi:hypothetical protein